MMTNFKVTIESLFHLLDEIKTNLTASLHDDKMLTEILGKIFKWIDHVFKSTRQVNPNEATITQTEQKKVNIIEIGKIAPLLLKLKVLDLKDLLSIITFVTNDKDKAKNVMSFIKESMKLLDLPDFKSFITIVPKQEKSRVLSIIKQTFKKLRTHNVDETDLFHICDALGKFDGQVDHSEFSLMARRLGVPLSEHRVMEIYANIKGNEAVEAKSMEFDEDEFSQALAILKEKQLSKSLQFMGIAPSQLYMTLGYLCFLLLLIFAFIFLGIRAFTVGGTFSAVINSLLPALGAVALGGKDNQKKDAVDTKVEHAVKETMAVVTGK
jgi:hypothetical protein